MAATLYGALVLAGLAIPGAVVEPLREASANPFAAAALAVLDPVAQAMERTGVPVLYRSAKERFRSMACGAPDSANPC